MMVASASMLLVLGCGGSSGTSSDRVTASSGEPETTTSNQPDTKTFVIKEGEEFHPTEGNYAGYSMVCENDKLIATKGGVTINSGKITDDRFTYICEQRTAQEKNENILKEILAGKTFYNPGENGIYTVKFDENATSYKINNGEEVPYTINKDELLFSDGEYYKLNKVDDKKIKFKAYDKNGDEKGNVLFYFSEKDANEHFNTSNSHTESENTTLINEGETITDGNGNKFSCQNGRVLGMGGAMSSETLTINGHTYKCK